MADTYIPTKLWHSLAASIAAAFDPDGGDEAIERAKHLLCAACIWPLIIAADVEAAG